MPRDKEKTKKKILETAIIEFQNEVYVDTGMVDLAKVLGTSRQTLYMQFKDRCTLLAEALQFATTEFDYANKIRKILENDRPLEDLDDFVATLNSYYHAVQGVLRNIISDRESKFAANTGWQEWQNSYRENCTSVIIKLKHADYLSPQWSVSVYTELLMTLLSFQNWEFLTGECKWTANQFDKNISKLVRSSLGVDTI